MDPDDDASTQVVSSQVEAIGLAMYRASSDDMPITVHDAVRASCILNRRHLRSARLVQDGAHHWAIRMGNSGVFIGPFESPHDARAAAGQLLTIAHSGPSMGPRR